MQSHVILTAIGTDRLGIVDDLSQEILRRSCNIEESRMALLGGEFAVLMLISGSEEMILNLIGDRETMEKNLHLSIQSRRTSAPSRQEDALPYTLESTSLDSPGIVHAVSAVLRQFGINISDMETETESAPWTGAPMFTLRARLFIPRELSIIAFRKELEKLELEYNLDLHLEPVV